VHVELTPWQSLFALVGLCLRTRVFITMHNRLTAVPKWRGWLWKLKFWVITRFENFHIFASNQDARESLRPLVSKEFLQKVKVTYTNVNPSEIDDALAAPFNRPELLQKFNLPADKFLVVCVGQFIDRKGRWTFLEAAQILNKTDEEIIFIWIYNSRPSDADLKKAARYGLGETFRLISSAGIGPEHLDLFKFLRLADVFTLPSFEEGLPISLLEAMALGIPSISTNVNAIPEAVIDQETGLLIEAGDAEALAGAIQTLKADKNLREKLSNNGRQWVLKHFDEREVARIAIASYQESLRKT
jgi:glycosyltransferase involved in cell wall biosynthesis